MRVIYQPKGLAAEYATWAANLYTGCTHGCRYCYVPSILRLPAETFWASVATRVPAGLRKPRADDTDLPVIRALRSDLRSVRRPANKAEILFCFTCDPYHPGDTTATRAGIQTVADESGWSRHLRSTVLTKGGKRAVRDFDLLREYFGRFGTSLTTMEEREPFAAPMRERIATIRAAKKLGISTWVSAEPITKVPSWLCASVMDAVDVIWFGRLNHIHSDIDWARLRAMLEERCARLGIEKKVRFKTGW